MNYLHYILDVPLWPLLLDEWMMKHELNLEDPSGRKMIESLIDVFENISSYLLAVSNFPQREFGSGKMNLYLKFV